MRDAAVTTAARDFLAPTNAGTATPEGPLCISPGIHALEDVHPLVSGPVSSDKATQQAAELSGLADWHSAVAVPKLVSALPSAAAQGASVTITGRGFTGVTGAASVKFGATNATSYTVNSDAQITAVMPAGSAGAANIVVTNAIGASAALSYTRGA